MGRGWSPLNRVRESYALKLAIALVSVVALTVAVGALVQAQTADQLRDDVQGQLTSISESQAGELETWLSNVNRQTRVLSEHPTINAGDTYRKRAVLRDLIADDGVPEGVVAVHYYDADEQTIVTSSAEDFVGVNPARENAPFATSPPTFDDADDVHVSEPFHTSITDFPVVAVMSPVPDDPSKQIIFMVNIEERTQSLTGMVEGGSTVVVDSDGRYIVHPETDQLLTTHGDGADSPVVEQGLAGESGFIEGETSDETGEQMVLAYAPIDSTDWVVAVRVPESEAYALGATVTSNIVGLILIAVVSLGLVGVTVGSNTVISLRQLSEKARAMESGDLGVSLETTRRDEFGTLYDSFDRMRDSLRDQVRESERAREEAEKARERTEDARKEAEERREEAQALSTHLETKASHYEEVMNAAADGDLRVRVDTESKSDAMVAIGESLNEMLDDTERTVASVKRFSAHVSNAVVDVEDSAEEVMATGEEVSESVAEISAGATDQTEHLSEVADRMNDLSASAQEVAATVDEVAATSEQAAAAGELGREAAEDALAEMDAVETATERTVEEIEDLDAEMAAIGDIVEVITEIADRTNMVAINASIEAARSGANGDGFAVVAEEVKSLAEKTKESASDIEGRIERVQSKTSQSVEGMTETSQRVTAGIETVEGAIDALEEIAAYVEETDASIHEINDATESQAEASSAVVTMVDDVASISEETATQAEGVADAAEDQTQTLTSVSRDAEGLAERAAELSELLDDFTVAQGAGPTDDTDFEFAEVEES
ncbi:methyl-accepting chemotaxis protein [Halorussus amylolyticus]|uniref:methyl-accepting chemotaxis protein n=1 Tax=Halorussus amylolyticus TaxID=1126242 RepID=UPI00138F5355|nr:methyl-accepting chemotaxis protein [Halorussus amylolyticus]